MLEEIKLKDMMEIMNFLKNDKEADCNPNEIWKVGNSYFVRTVTMHILGKLKLVTKKELVFENASWIADAGRFHDALKNGELNEIEPFCDDVIINRDCVVDATIWNHKLPDQQK